MLKKKFAYIKNVPYLCIAFKGKHFPKSRKGDSLAQLVEHNTFNVGVLGSSPRRITRNSESYIKVALFFYAKIALVYMVQLNRELNQEWKQQLM